MMVHAAKKRALSFPVIATENFHNNFQKALYC